MYRNKNNTDAWFREQIARLDHTPPPTLWDAGDAWEQIAAGLEPKPRTKPLYLRPLLAAATFVLLLMGWFVWQSPAPQVATQAADLSDLINRPIPPQQSGPVATKEAAEPITRLQAARTPRKNPIKEESPVPVPLPPTTPLPDTLATYAATIVPDSVPPQAVEAVAKAPTARLPVMRFDESPRMTGVAQAPAPQNNVRLRLKVGNTKRRYEPASGDVAGISTRIRP